ncbi:MAG: hypothetical protein IPK50_20670 [Fibrobacterota bacterium]|nr:MAG: hypothetical protein IPK50_20670 [Fibrobacterota bacterium]
MITAAALLLALPGQLLNSSTSNALFRFHQIWEVNPEVAARPTTPSVYQGWDREMEPSFVYAKWDVGSFGDTIFRDTVVATWDPVKRFYSEEHHSQSKSTGFLSSPPYFRIHIHGIDTSRGRWGRAIADSIFNWQKDSATQPWKPVASLVSRDTTGGRVFHQWTLGGLLADPDDTSRIRILERYDASGFLTFRQLDQWSTDHWWMDTQDSVQRGTDGMPQRALSWSGYDGGRKDLVKDGKLVWNGHALSSLAATATMQNALGNDTSITYTQKYLWSQGRLESMENSIYTDGAYLTLTYDAQGRVVTYSRSGQTERYLWNAQGKVASLRTFYQFGLDPADLMLVSTDSFEYDAKGRMTRKLQFPTVDDTLPDLTRPTTSTYDYSISVPVRAPARAVRGSVSVQGRTLLASDLPTGIVQLRIVRPDGQTVRQAEGSGTLRMDLSGLGGTVLLWSLEQDGRSLAGGKFLPAP